MAGTVEGGKRAAATNKAKHGSDFYAKIGAMGGKKGKTGGFYANPELARIAGAKGGKISKRTSKKLNPANIPLSSPKKSPWYIRLVGRL